MVGIFAIWRNLEAKGYTNLIGRTSSELDLRNQQAVLAFFQNEKPEVVIDAAARVGGILANSEYPYQFLMENLQIQNNLIDGAHNNGVEKFIFLGSSCIYPRLAPQPLKEEYLLTGLLEPTNEWYAIAKITGVKLCQDIRNQFGKDLTIKELAETIQKIVGHTGEIIWDSSKPDGTPRKLLDVSKLNTLVWKAEIELQQGVEKTYEWFLEKQQHYNRNKTV